MECFTDFSSLGSRMPRLFDFHEQNLRNLLSEGCCDDIQEKIALMIAIEITGI